MTALNTKKISIQPQYLSMSQVSSQLFYRHFSQFIYLMWKSNISDLSSESSDTSYLPTINFEFSLFLFNTPFPFSNHLSFVKVLKSDYLHFFNPLIIFFISSPFTICLSSFYRYYKVLLTFYFMAKRSAVTLQKTQKQSKRRRIRRTPKFSVCLTTKIGQNSINSTIKWKKRRFGRRETSCFEKTRIKIMKNPSRVLAHFFSQLSFNMIAIYNLISPSRQRCRRKKQQPLRPVKLEEITQFCEGNKWLFIKIFACMVKDNHLSMHEALETVFEKKPHIQNVPGSFIHGLSELKQAVCMARERNFLTLKPLDVKIFYLISLLIIGVPKFNQILSHIDYPTENLSLDSMVDSLFEKMYISHKFSLEKLLSETKILTSITFEKLTQQWDIIMETIMVQELSNNQNPIQTYDKKAFHLYSAPTMEQLKKILGNASRKESIIADQQIRKFIESEERKIRLRELNENDDINEFFNLESERLDSRLEGDAFPYFVDFNSQISGNIIQNDPNQEDPGTPQITQRNQASQNPTQKQQAVVELISKKLAVKYFNFEQKKKRLNRNIPASSYSSRTNLLSNSLQEALDNSVIMISSENLSASNKEIGFEESIQNQNTSISRTLNDQSVQNEESLIQVGQSGGQAPDHNVPHTKRQVDYLIKELNKEKYAIARAIANQIYHTMDLLQIKIEFGETH